MVAKKKETLAQKVALAGVVLVIKRVILQFIFTVSNIFLARLLFPADFGTFAIVSSVVILFNVFSDLGLIPALIQKKEKPNKSDISSALTFQLILGFLIVAVIFLTSNLISSFYHLNTLGVKLLRLYSLIFLIAPFRQIPSAILERNLDYKKLALIEVGALFLGSGSSVFFALKGFGVYSLVLGQIVGHVAAAILYLQISLSPISFGINRKNLIAMSRFGFPFQTNQVFGLFYGPLILLYLGRQVGPGNLGFYQFAASISVVPLAFSEIVSRVVFPLGARTSGNREYFRKIIERSIVLVSATSLPIVFMMLVLAGEIVHFIYTDRWLPSLPALYLGLVQMGVVAFTGVFSQLLLSLGRAKVIRNMGFIWAILTWALTPFLIVRFNFVGLSLANLLVSVTGFLLYYQIKKQVNFSIWPNFYPYLFKSIVASAITFAIYNSLPRSLMSLAASLIVGGVVYLGLIALFNKKMLVENFKFFISAFEKL